MTRTLMEQVMTTPVVTATETMPFRDLAALLFARDIGAVPVVAPAGQLLGVVSRPDLIPKTAGLAAAAGLCPGIGSRRRERRRALARTAGQLMTAPAVTVAPQATVELAARLMVRHRVGRLPVISPLTGRLAGIVTRSDLLRVYRRPGEEIRAEIETEVLARVRGADPRRLAVSVRDGVVLISGQVEVRSAVARLVSAVLTVEGVVGVDQRVGFDLDDRYPPSRSPSYRRTRAASVVSTARRPSGRPAAVKRDRAGRTTGRSARKEGRNRCGGPPHDGGPPSGERVTRRRTS